MALTDRMYTADRSLPECDYCGRVIRQKRWYEINGDTICKTCLDENFRCGADDGDDDEGDEDE